MSEAVNQIKIGAALDGTFDTTIQSGKRKMGELGAAAREAGKGTGAIGDGMAGSAQKVEAATKNMVGSIQRQIAALEAGDKSSRRYQESLARMRGIDTAALKPYLDQLDAVKAKQEAANLALLSSRQGMDSVGMSAKAMSANLRGIPAQFTDIVTSLQGGQKPLTVLLQQGGQLKDMFGGVGNATKALGSYVLGLINPFTIAAAALGTLALAYVKGAAESEAFNKALIMTGNYAGTTSLQMSQMAKAISGATGSTIGAAAEALTALAASGDVSAAQFTRLGTAVTQWSKATGMSVGDVAKQFSKLQDEPLKATLALNDSQHYLTRTIYDQIKALEDQGRMLEAGALAQNAWADAIGQRTPALVENLGVVEKAWRGIAGTAKAAWDAMLNVGRSTDPVAAIKTRISELENLLKNPRTGKIEAGDNQGFMGRRYLEELSLMNQKLALQEKGAGYEAQSAAYQREEAKATEAKVAWAKESDKYLSKQVQMQREIAKAQSLYSQQKPEDQNPDKYAETIAGIQKKYAEAPKHIKAASDAYMSLYSALEKNNEQSLIELDTGAKVTAGEKERLESMKQIDALYRKKQIGVVESEVLKSIADETAANHALAKARKDAQKAQIDAIKFMQDENKPYEDHAKVLRASEKAIEDYADSAKLMADDLVFETKLIGLNTAERERAIEQRKIQLELDKEIRRINDTAGLTFEEKESQKARAMQAAVSSASNAAARSSLNEWMKTADSIRDSLVDAFDSAILTGKDLFTSLRDAAVKLFDGLVLRPILQGVLQPVATALTGSLIGTAANAAAGASATSGLLSSVTGIGASAGAGSISSLLGSSGMGALDIMGFDPTTLAIGAAILVLSQMGGKFVSASDSGRAQIAYGADGTAGTVSGTTGDAAQIAAATKNTNTLAKTYYDTAKSLGITAMQAAFEVGTNTGREGAAPQTVLGVNIGKSSFSSGEIASTDAAGLSLAASRAVLTALQASELPSYLSGVFDDITASTATQEQITAAITYAGSLKAIREALLETREPLQIVRDNVADAFASLGTSADTFKTDFVAAIDSGISQENLAKWQTLGTALDTLAADAAATAKAIKEAAASIYSAQTSQYSNLLSAQKEQADYAEQAAQASQQAAQESAQAAQQAAQAITQAFAQAGQGIADFIKTLLGEIANPATLQNSYLSDLAGAKGGDLQASQRLPASAKAYLDSQISNSATSSEANIARARMAAELSRLPAVKTYEQQSLDALNAIGSGVSSTVTAVQDLNGKLIVDLNVQAQSELLKILTFTANTDGLSPEFIELALKTESSLDKTIKLSVQQKDPYALAVALAQGGTVNTLFTVSGGDLTPEQLALINGIEKYNKNVLIGVRIDATELTALQQQLMTTFGTIDLNALGGAGIDITSVVNQGALSRLNSISTYIRTLDWSSAGKGASAWATYDAARAYGVTQADIANAMGLKYTDIQSLFDTYNIPRFAAGSNYLPDDMLAQVHQGERIIPAADNRELMQRLQNPQANSETLVTEIRSLREENRAQASAMVQMQQRLTKLMERWDGNGMPETRVTA